MPQDEHAQEDRARRRPHGIMHIAERGVERRDLVQHDLHSASTENTPTTVQSLCNPRGSGGAIKPEPGEQPVKRQRQESPHARHGRETYAETQPDNILHGRHYSADRMVRSMSQDLVRERMLAPRPARIGTAALSYTRWTLACRP